MIGGTLLRSKRSRNCVYLMVNQYSRMSRDGHLRYIVFKGRLTETPCCDILLGRHSAQLPGLDDGDDEEDDARNTREIGSLKAELIGRSIQAGSGGSVKPPPDSQHSSITTSWICPTPNQCTATCLAKYLTICR